VLRAIALTAAGLTGAAVALNAWLAAGRRRRPPREPAMAEPSSMPVSRDELYEMAERLDIPGRSKMSKAELERELAPHLAGRRLAA
jgi:hypothetical protein